MRRKVLMFLMIVFVLSITGCSKTSSDIDNYLNTGTTIDKNCTNIMPTLDSLPKYKSIDYRYTHKSMFIFESDSVALIVSYDDKTYKAEKEKLAKTYTFVEENTNEAIPEFEFSINSYTFKIAAEDEENYTEFPKSFGMIGTSEEKKSIAYLYFYDFDLDYISRDNEEHPMANFVNNYFDYDF